MGKIGSGRRKDKVAEQWTMDLKLPEVGKERVLVRVEEIDFVTLHEAFPCFFFGREVVFDGFDPLFFPREKSSCLIVFDGTLQQCLHFWEVVSTMTKPSKSMQQSNEILIGEYDRFKSFGRSTEYRRWRERLSCSPHSCGGTGCRRECS